MQPASAAALRPEIIGAVGGFRGIAHRIEYVGEKGGVRFYDDSKGTNVGAVVRALQSFSDPVVLLLGGRDKEGDFETLIPLIRERVQGDGALRRGAGEDQRPHRWHGRDDPRGDPRGGVRSGPEDRRPR